MQGTLQQLRTTGMVRLPGTPARTSRLLRGLTLVLVVLIGLVGIGGLGFGVVAIATGAVEVTAATIMGMVMVLAMMAGLMALVLWWRRSLGRYAQVENLPLVIDASGLTLRGIGPIPWWDFGPAEHRMVPAEHDDGYTRRAVMTLTRSGFHNVNVVLPEHLRSRISPAHGPFWNKRHDWIYVPGVAGLGEGEVMDLINTARAMYGSRPPAS